MRLQETKWKNRKRTKRGASLEGNKFFSGWERRNEEEREELNFPTEITISNALQFTKIS